MSVKFVETMQGIEVGNAGHSLAGLGEGGGLLDFLGLDKILGGGSKAAADSFTQFQMLQAGREAARAKQRTTAVVGGIAAAVVGIGLIVYLVKK